MVEMEEVLHLHSSADVLEASARTFLYLCEGENPSRSAARAARDTLVQKWVDKLTTLLQNSLKVGQKIISAWIQQIIKKKSLIGSLLDGVHLLWLLLQDDCYSADSEQTGEILATLKKLRAFHK